MFTILSTSNFTALSFGGNSGGSWGFIVFWIAQCADVLFFCGALWLLCNAEGRRHVARGMWLVVTLLAVYPPSYYGGFGPEKSPPLPFSLGTLIAVGIGLAAFGWGVLSGFNTEEFQEVVRAAEAGQPAPANPTPRSGTTAA